MDAARRAHSSLRPFLGARSARARRLVIAVGLLLLGLAAGASCSLVNAFDDVKGGPGSPLGIIVVAGRLIVAGTKVSERVFAVLEASTGAELRRYPLSVVAATYDPATDLWYLFEASSLPPQNGEAIKLHIGTIDPYQGTWTEIGVAGEGLPTITESIDVGVLNRRLVYAAFDPSFDAGGIPPIGVAVVDTSARAAPVPAFAPSGFVDGLPSFYGFILSPNPTTPGGQVNLITQNQVDMITQSCAADAGVCELHRRLVTVPNTAMPPPPPITDHGIRVPHVANGIATASGSERTNGPFDLVATPPLSDSQPATVERFVPDDTTSTDTVYFDSQGGGQFSGLAVSECLRAAIISDRGAKLLYALPLQPQASASAPLTPAKVALSDSATVVYFEPVTSTVVMPFQPANADYHLDAWDLGGTEASPQLSTKATWTPPGDIAVDAVAIRQPKTFTCPRGS
jgi:hypothetical protein